MLHYYGTDMSAGIDVNKTNESHKCIICNYFTFVTRRLPTTIILVVIGRIYRYQLNCNYLKN